MTGGNDCVPFPSLRSSFMVNGMRSPRPSLSSSSELLPRARHALLPDAGHMPFWEAPERFFDVAGSFLAAPSTGPPRTPP